MGRNEYEDDQDRYEEYLSPRDRARGRRGGKRANVPKGKWNEAPGLEEDDILWVPTVFDIEREPSSLSDILEEGDTPLLPESPVASAVVVDFREHKEQDSAQAAVVKIESSKPESIVLGKKDADRMRTRLERLGTGWNKYVFTGKGLEDLQEEYDKMKGQLGTIDENQLTTLLTNMYKHMRLGFRPLDSKQQAHMKDRWDNKRSDFGPWLIYAVDRRAMTEAQVHALSGTYFLFGIFAMSQASDEQIGELYTKIDVEHNKNILKSDIEKKIMSENGLVVGRPSPEMMYRITARWIREKETTSASL